MASCAAQFYPPASGHASKFNYDMPTFALCRFVLRMEDLYFAGVWSCCSAYLLWRDGHPFTDSSFLWWARAFAATYLLIEFLLWRCCPPDQDFEWRCLFFNGCKAMSVYYCWLHFLWVVPCGWLLVVPSLLHHMDPGLTRVPYVRKLHQNDQLEYSRGVYAFLRALSGDLTCREAWIDLFPVMMPEPPCRRDILDAFSQEWILKFHAAKARHSEFVHFLVEHVHLWREKQKSRKFTRSRLMNLKISCAFQVAAICEKTSRGLPSPRLFENWSAWETAVSDRQWVLYQMCKFFRDRARGYPDSRIFPSYTAYAQARMWREGVVENCVAKSLFFMDSRDWPPEPGVPFLSEEEWREGGVWFDPAAEQQD